jgi:MFS family permease
MVVGLFVASTVIGRVVTRTGRYKRWMLLGAALLTTGMGLMGLLLDEHTSLVELGAFMMIAGAGIGMLMQNLVLIVQNSVATSDVGAGSGLIAFFRSLGGAIGVSVLGAILAARASSSIVDGLAQRGIDAGGAGGSGQVPDVHALPAPAAAVVEHAYASGIAEIFLVAAPLGLVVFVALALMHERPLGMKSGIEITRERELAAQPAH